MPLPSANKTATAADIHLVLFMTAGMSLMAWDALGMFEREVALYRRLRPHVRAISIVSYGGPEDLSFAGRLPGIGIICNRWRLPPTLYRLVITKLLPCFWRGPVVVKTNQIAGGDLAREAAANAGAGFVARCGYMLSEFTARAHGGDSERARADADLERRVFGVADACVVTTAAMAETVVGYGVGRERLRIIPNYVETDRLKPEMESRDDGRVAFIGRLDDQKNVFALVSAMRQVSAELVVIGDGPHGPALKQLAAQEGARVTFLGRLSHGDIPNVLNTCAAFILPSLYEGHPKALLEAMACGLAVIGTDVPGIREVLRHGDTGWLCQPDQASIAEALNAVLSNGELRRRLGERARQQILETCTLERVVDLERAMLEDVARVVAGRGR